MGDFLDYIEEAYQTEAWSTPGGLGQFEWRTYRTPEELDNISVDSCRDGLRSLFKIFKKSNIKIRGIACRKLRTDYQVPAVHQKYTTYDVQIITDGLGVPLRDFLFSYQSNFGSYLYKRTINSSKDFYVLDVDSFIQHPGIGVYKTRLSGVKNRTKYLIKCFYMDSAGHQLDDVCMMQVRAVDRNVRVSGLIGSTATLMEKLGLAPTSLGASGSRDTYYVLAVRDGETVGEYKTIDDIRLDRLSVNNSRIVVRVDSSFYSTLIDTIRNTPVTGDRNFDSSMLFSDTNWSSMLNAGGYNPRRFIFSEILAPLLLAAGFLKLDGRRILDLKEDWNVETVILPASNNFMLSDFGFTAFQVNARNIRTGITKTIMVSAKLGSQYHRPSLLSLLKVKPYIGGNRNLKALNHIANSPDTPVPRNLPKFGEVDDTGVFSKWSPSSLIAAADVINRDSNTLLDIYNYIFNFHSDMGRGTYEFSQLHVEIEEGAVGATGIVCRNIRRQANAEGGAGLVEIHPGTVKSPLQFILL